MLLICAPAAAAALDGEPTCPSYRPETGGEVRGGETHVFNGVRQIPVLISCPAASVSCHLGGNSQ